jgi:hypothetical protein
LFIFERPSIFRRLAWFFSCSRVGPLPFRELVERLRGLVVRRRDELLAVRARPGAVGRLRPDVVALPRPDAVERLRADVDLPRADVVDLRPDAVERLRPDVVDLPRLEAVERLRPDVVDLPRLDAVERLRPEVAVFRRPGAVERLRAELPDARVRDVEALARGELLLARLLDGELLFEELALRLFTVRAATAFARGVDAPRLFALLLIFEYWRAVLVPFFTPAGGT